MCGHCHYFLTPTLSTVWELVSQRSTNRKFIECFCCVKLSKLDVKLVFIIFAEKNCGKVQRLNIKKKKNQIDTRSYSYN